MSLSAKLLLDGEHVVEETRTHVKVLVLPFLLGLAVMAVAGFTYGAIGDSADTWVRVAVVGVALVLLTITTVVPFLRWYLWTYTLTNLRIVEQRGILTRTGRIIPLMRVNDVNYEKHLIDRILRCGTLIVHDASHQAGLRLHDVPRIEEFHRSVSRLVFDNRPSHQEVPRGESS
ncbi:PH domain-containing protein [uncultured Aeromicrobium sp.]|uniref:PH domain-containing protein n=1 Tax=uncultured Aeromicrobium sp. TaxID=337820 RepID=UPI0025DB7743|nr:PH domain-containing protein [uncultured Aeromicrobium sp.]